MKKSKYKKKIRKRSKILNNIRIINNEWKKYCLYRDSEEGQEEQRLFYESIIIEWKKEYERYDGMQEEERMDAVYKRLCEVVDSLEKSEK